MVGAFVRVGVVHHVWSIEVRVSLRHKILVRSNLMKMNHAQSRLVMLLHELGVRRHLGWLVEELRWLVAHRHWVLGYELMVHALLVQPLPVMLAFLEEGRRDLAGLRLIWEGVSAHYLMFYFECSL